MGQGSLGEFEQMVLLAVLQLGDYVYGVPIVDKIERRTGRSVARALVPDSPESDQLRRWLHRGHPIAMSTRAWGEFLCGTLEDGARTLARRIARGHVPLGTREAEEAARLFNGTGRRRGRFQDCLVAATAILSGAVFATSDRSDFGRLATMGIEMAD